MNTIARNHAKWWGHDMTRKKSFVAATALAALSWVQFIPGASAGPGARIDVRSTLPVACEASIVVSQIVTITPLLINASVHQACNTRHDLSVTYAPLSVMQPSRLFVTFDGASPNIKAPGSQTFTNLAHTDSVKPLTIRYAGGTILQRKELVRTLGIAVTAH